MTWLADRGCINVGIDSPSVDSSKAFTDKGYWAHKACRERKVLNVENLANLKEVVNTKFIFSCLPLKIRKGTARPCARWRFITIEAGPTSKDEKWGQPFRVVLPPVVVRPCASFRFPDFRSAAPASSLGRPLPRAASTGHFPALRGLAPSPLRYSPSAPQ